MATKLDPHEPAVLRTMAHQLRRTDPAKSAEYARKARAADEALETEVRDRIRAACLKSVQATYPSATPELVASVDDGRAKGTLSLRAVGGKGREAELAIFRYLENPPL